MRIIEYTFDDLGRPGSGETHRLLSTLLDAGRHPATRLSVLYHERWEEELAIDELKTHQRERAVLRSETPAGAVQEIYGLLLGHYVVRKLMCEAATLADCAPRELSFVNTLNSRRQERKGDACNPRRHRSARCLLGKINRCVPFVFTPFVFQAGA